MKMKHFIVLAGLFALCAVGALTPLSPRELRSFSDHIFTGRVLDITYRDVPNAQFPAEWITRHYRLTVEVQDVVKTVKEGNTHYPDNDDETISQGDTVHVLMWQAHKRFPDFTGDTGVTLVPQAIGRDPVPDTDVRDPARETVPPLHNGVYGFFARYSHKDPARVAHMYHESFPHNPDHPDAHLKRYNVLTPNGIVSDAASLLGKGDL